ncbi:hypothetical protein V6N12_059017 [Hibiscus sabdariffa]|uniref:Uncharacterized protein n=1 Tax=Hibiscus sabdariffa TaxID=183260 RepID=A0ABR2ETU6_9ROSI
MKAGVSDKAPVVDEGATKTSGIIVWPMIAKEIAIEESNFQEFPPLQASNQKKAKGKGEKNDSIIVGFANKFDLLAYSKLDNAVNSGRKPRVASLGVAQLLQEMKAKKKDQL